MLRATAIDDKYALSVPQVFINGSQALVRLCLLQAQRDRLAGFDTAGYVSGYRGSPLGGLDQQFHAAAAPLAQAGVVFQPGLNEDLAATAVWGTQQIDLFGEAAKDGVFALWYGKGPGVDRSGDVLRHGNLAGSAARGGVVLVLGDDHSAESSTTCHQSEYALVDALIPILNPSNLQEIVEYGLHGWALSRSSGLWVGLKCVKDNVESSASVTLPDEHYPVRPLTATDQPAGGLNIRPNDDRRQQEVRLHRYKLAAAQHYARLNQLDQIVWRSDTQPRIGIVSTGKSWLDVLQALRDLAIDAERAATIGLSLYKVGMSWPLEPEGLERFALGLQLLICIEEKRGLIEDQARAILYRQREAPAIIGKCDERGQPLFGAAGSLDAAQIGAALRARLGPELAAPQLAVPELAAPELAAPELAAPGFSAKVPCTARSTKPLAELTVARSPYFCAGCPHNRSTVLPQGARGYAGIGCHWMVQTMQRTTQGSTQMGGEGANWIGEALFSKRKHVFQNLGDGTYNHSGLMAMRAALAAGVNITYKILYNDAVAMTGGQQHDGGLRPARIVAEVLASGVAKLEVVADDPDSIDAVDARVGLPGGVIHHRDTLQAVQRALAQIPGVTVLLYIQTCAAEKRRRRKRGLLADPARHVLINAEVCEGCGDCGVQSNCVAILPLPTALGRKRQIDASNCNKDFSCLKGFCPSFVQIDGGQRRSGATGGSVLAVPSGLPEASASCSLQRPWAILLTGVGGTGVVTLGALLGMAAHLEHKGCGIIDMAGLAQKGGAVTSHIRIAAQPAEIDAIRIADGGADLLLGGDLLVSGADSSLRLLRPEGALLANTHEVMSGEFVRDADFVFPSETLVSRLQTTAGERAILVDATNLALALLGDAIAANLLLLGVAYQRGLIPLSAAALERAIVLNGVAVATNLAAFAWGRAYVLDPERVRRQAYQSAPAPERDRQIDALPGAELGVEPGADFASSGAERATGNKVYDLQTLLADRCQRLRDYQDQAYAERYRRYVEAVAARDTDEAGRLSRVVGENLFTLMAYKDEYEVARLYTDGRFTETLRRQFSGDYRVSLWLAPPLLSWRRDPATGRPQKRRFGPWIWPLLRGLAHAKRLRGSWADPFGYSAERRRERALIGDYQNTINSLLDELVAGRADYQTIIAIAALPQQIRGFGPVKNASIAVAKRREAEYLQAMRERTTTTPGIAPGAATSTAV